MEILEACLSSSHISQPVPLPTKQIPLKIIQHSRVLLILSILSHIAHSTKTFKTLLLPVIL